MVHKLKIWPQFYERVKDGSKTFEVRDNDRGFQLGDTVVLQEFNPEPLQSVDKHPQGYTGSPDLTFKVGYIYVLSASQVIFSLIPIKTIKTK